MGVLLTIPNFILRDATPADAPVLARLANMAGEGLPAHLWAGMAEQGQSAFDVGAARAARTEGAFSWCNARVLTWQGAVVGAAIFYDLTEIPTADDIRTTPPLLRPLVELEAEVPGTRYLNVLAVVPQARRRGVAKRLIADIRSPDDLDLTLIVASENLTARTFYAREGFDELARRPMGPGGPSDLKGDWILMRRRSGQRVGMDGPIPSS
ncbi:GNAT family N-acetyltransferase [Jannaschia sp. CCS1]|uniref:GNAT family N-acetyltransferase n=1 Tax=Jannaschia sp. (strain CCS1) TaxID=290400 RepID=UPI000053B4C8|nr:GNAT family N-acetyltransferase [Jannaschia sp. CCS1]ABD56591.1 acetyltransferase GNAT family [Jannaschia sp. CCS1]